MRDSQESGRGGVPLAARHPLVDRWYFVLLTGLVATVVVVAVTMRWCSQAEGSDPAFLLVQVLKWGAFYFLLRWHMRARDPYAKATYSIGGELRSFGLWVGRACLVVLATLIVWRVLALLFPSAYW